ncbi:lipoamide acyltransferase component of branched-chain alpha-keto acid dehydrogenase complex, mitochondrial [Cydia strobilella]|uniref:lipoamide acyltransferase component of branched-chain alpha-keto acid dehydrogenase complex, mitochondrial n=1 Tax=Cydia strobilella TaxID=1100964 RepID=UPI003003F3EE
MSILRTIVRIRNVNKCRMSCMLVQNDRLRSRNNEPIRLQASPGGVTRPFHTTTILDKIVKFKLSDIGEGIREVIVKEWFVKVGDKVQQFDNICEVQSDKAAVTITSRYDGTITKLYADVDQTVFVGQPLIDIEAEDGAEDSTPSLPEEVNKDAATPVPSDIEHNQRIRVLTTPAVRRIAAQFKVNLSTVTATGRNGRVLKEDVLAHLGISAEKSNEVPDAVQAVQTRAAKAEPAVDRTVPVTGFMKAMVKSMSESMKIPHLVLSDEYDVTKLFEARQNIKSLAERQGVKLSYMPIIVKAASLSLTEYPVLNSSPDSACETLTYKASHNIGLGMDTPNGLVVPVIKNVQNKSILEIARELNVLQEKGMKGQLGLNDLSGGTFTLSNVGVVGGTYASPIIFSPQVSIGALGKIQVLPRFDAEGNVVKAHILTVSWAADHRVVDGATVARFSNRMKQYLENPYTLLLDL